VDICVRKEFLSQLERPKARIPYMYAHEQLNNEDGVSIPLQKMVNVVDSGQRSEHAQLGPGRFRQLKGHTRLGDSFRGISDITQGTLEHLIDVSGNLGSRRRISDEVSSACVYCRTLAEPKRYKTYLGEQRKTTTSTCLKGIFRSGRS